MFKMPETLDGLTLAELSALLEDALAAATELNEIPDDKITSEQRKELIQLVSDMATVAEARDAVELEEGAEAAALAAAREAVANAKADENADEDADAEDADKGDADADADADAEVVEEKVDADALVAAGAKIRKSFASKVAGQSTKHDEKQDEADPMDEARSKSLSIRAAANVPNFVADQPIEGFDQLAEAYAARSRSFATSRNGRKGNKGIENVSFDGVSLSDSAQRFSVAKLDKPENEYTITEKMSAEEQFDLIKAAASEKRLGGGSLVAAGGWCSPSEQIYGFLELESADGLLSIAEINAKRGGISYTKGPQLGDLLIEANLGFVQTETEAEAGDVKPIFDIECPDWDEVRMDAVGYAIRAGLLTQAAYPELVRRYLGLGLIVHARRMNALTISRIRTLITDAFTFGSVGANPSFPADLLSAIELHALRIREMYSMAIRSTVEAVFPLWVRAVVRSDLSRRTGVDMISVTDAQIDGWFKQRQINPQFVRDYQGINTGAANTSGGTAAWTRWPDKVEFMMYPAGSYVRLATSVIDLDTVHDVDNLTQNQFMAAFFEEGFGIANTGGSGSKVTVNIPNLYGATGYPGIGDLTNVAP